MKNGMYESKDFVDVVDGQGRTQPAVPKAWVGTDLLPEGTKAAKSGRSRQQQSAPAGDSGGGQGEGGSGDGAAEVPPESENRDVLEQFATEHAGMSQEQAKAYPNKGELHAAIVTAVEAQQQS